MKLLRQITVIKVFLYIIMGLYVCAIIYPWVLIVIGYTPASQGTNSYSPTPFQFAASLSISIAIYAGMVVIPLAIASLYAVRSLRKKYNSLSSSSR